MNHSFKNLPRAKEVNEQQGTMYSTKAVSGVDDDVTCLERNSIHIVLKLYLTHSFLFT